MLDVNALKAEMARNGYTQTSLAKELGMTPKTFSLRLKSRDFCSREIEIMIEALKLKDPMGIFFAK